MKQGIHPQAQDITITCIGCGFTLQTISTKSSYTVETCMNCHQFYTGEKGVNTTKGRAEKFMQKQEAAKEYKEKLKSKKQKEKKSQESKSLKDLLSGI